MPSTVNFIAPLGLFMSTELRLAVVHVRILACLHRNMVVCRRNDASSGPSSSCDPPASARALRARLHQRQHGARCTARSGHVWRASSARAHAADGFQQLERLQLQLTRSSSLRYRGRGRLRAQPRVEARHLRRCRRHVRRLQAVRDGRLGGARDHGPPPTGTGSENASRRRSISAPSCACATT
jgi:hypothetical protein